jgi:hypothetical protein
MSLHINVALWLQNLDKLCIIFTFTSLPIFFKNTTHSHCVQNDAQRLLITYPMYIYIDALFY